MAKVHPLTLSSSPADPSSACKTSKTESFTVWMKSLVMQANGCTVYNEDGEVIYRVDNYDTKGSTEVYLMDLKGTVVFTIKKQWLFREWKGYKSDGLKLKTQKPFFQMRKSSRFLKGNLCSEIVVRSQDGCYKIEASAGKSAFKITNSNGRIVAKATRKETSSGVVLGDDVLRMEVEAEVDRSFIMALVTVYGLMHHRL